ncbi:carbonic anhydrase [Actinoplanes sp. L3-i22]|uniref:carbonic anhydrase n=1 Tax=Actinoplanes sp. L3-i22 TaxID=2836373 RepID=UPI001C772341|nr:carbonic anhydrase [Actinoplanes sp. L3-i22]BCY08935.1 carbonic anhydrase [Actinoplanes sp. L3-i22]
MTEFSQLLERNRDFAATVDLRYLAMPEPATMPERMPLILTCVDPRVEPAGFLGLRTGDAGVLRNAGGRVDERVMDDIAFLGMRLGVRLDVVVIHHTQCGTGLLADPAFRRSFADRAGLDDAVLAAKAVTDPAQTVREDVAKLLANPVLSSDLVASVSGHVLRLETGLVDPVAVLSTPTA